MSYELRTYRMLHRENDLTHFQVKVKETDLDIAVKKERYCDEFIYLVRDFIGERRKELEEFIEKDKKFLKALDPYKPQDDAPSFVKQMCEAGELAGTGPMAAVAGYFAQQVGELLTNYSKDVIVENGGDIWLKSSKTRRIGIYAGKSPFTNRIGLEIKAEQTPLAICTSSATIGHSLSFGQADSVIIIATSAVLADAVATAACNQVKSIKDLEKAVEFALSIAGIRGALAILDDKMAAQGEIKLVPLN